MADWCVYVVLAKRDTCMGASLDGLGRATRNRLVVMAQASGEERGRFGWDSDEDAEAPRQKEAAET